MQPSQQARLVLSAEPPYGITYTNEAWTALMGHSTDQAKMFPFTLMNVRRNTRQERRDMSLLLLLLLLLLLPPLLSF